MERNFNIYWYEKRKPEITRINQITVPNPIGDIGYDCQRAVSLFTSTFGNLVKNEIIKIIEIDKDGHQIGEDIVPMGESRMIPTQRA